MVVSSILSGPATPNISSQYQQNMFQKISTFIGEVRGELRKASWPWDPDPKAKGLKKYKELVDSTVVVMIAIVLLAGFVAISDLLLSKAIKFISTSF